MITDLEHSRAGGLGEVEAAFGEELPGCEDV